MFLGFWQAALFVIGGCLLLLGVVLPRVLWPLQRVWMGVAVLFGWIMTRVVLLLIFYGILFPIGLIARVVGKQFLQENIQKERQSYWNMRPKRVYSKISHEQQF